MAAGAQPMLVRARVLAVKRKYGLETDAAERRRYSARSVASGRRQCHIY